MNVARLYEWDEDWIIDSQGNLVDKQDTLRELKTITLGADYERDSP
jgi:hypothetical protein